MNEFFSTHLGETAALLTAFFWTITALAFESASVKVGSLAVNVIRLLLGLLFLSFFTWIRIGNFFPANATGYQWFWLSVSGLIGFVLGDLFLFKSYTIIGSRFAMLIMTLVPPISAFLGWIMLGEALSLMNIFGMMLTFLGISLAIFSRGPGQRRLNLKLSPKGIFYAFLGALGQALGLVLSKFGMQDYDPFAATQIRIIAGIVGFSIFVSIIGRWKRVISALNHGPAIAGISIGSFFGPFLGVSFSLVAIKYTETGIASTIMAIVPILIIPPAIIIFKQKVSLIEIVGSIISIIGVSLFFVV